MMLTLIVTILPFLMFNFGRALNLKIASLETLIVGISRESMTQLLQTLRDDPFRQCSKSRHHLIPHKASQRYINLLYSILTSNIANIQILYEDTCDTMTTESFTYLLEATERHLDDVQYLADAILFSPTCLKVMINEGSILTDQLVLQLVQRGLTGALSLFFSDEAEDEDDGGYYHHHHQRRRQQQRHPTLHLGKQQEAILQPATIADERVIFEHDKWLVQNLIEQQEHLDLGRLFDISFVKDEKYVDTMQSFIKSGRGAHISLAAIIIELETSTTRNQHSHNSKRKIWKALYQCICTIQNVDQSSSAKLLASYIKCGSDYNSGKKSLKIKRPHSQHRSQLEMHIKKAEEDLEKFQGTNAELLIWTRLILLAYKQSGQTDFSPILKIISKYSTPLNGIKSTEFIKFLVGIWKVHNREITHSISQSLGVNMNQFITSYLNTITKNHGSNIKELLRMLNFSGQVLHFRGTMLELSAKAAYLTREWKPLSHWPFTTWDSLKESLIQSLKQEDKRIVVDGQIIRPYLWMNDSVLWRKILNILVYMKIRFGDLPFYLDSNYCALMDVWRRKSKVLDQGWKRAKLRGKFGNIIDIDFESLSHFFHFPDSSDLYQNDTSQHHVSNDLCQESNNRYQASKDRHGRSQSSKDCHHHHQNLKGYSHNNYHHHKHSNHNRGSHQIDKRQCYNQQFKQAMTMQYEEMTKAQSDWKLPHWGKGKQFCQILSQSKTLH